MGLIPAPELLDRQVEIYRLFRKADAESVAEALRMHGEILPWIVMMTRAGVEGMLLFGKALMARRLGLPAPVMLAPAVNPNEFGMAEVERMHAALGQL